MGSQRRGKDPVEIQVVFPDGPVFAGERLVALINFRNNSHLAGKENASAEVSRAPPTNNKHNNNVIQNKIQLDKGTSVRNKVSGLGIIANKNDAPEGSPDLTFDQDFKFPSSIPKDTTNGHKTELSNTELGGNTSLDPIDDVSPPRHKKSPSISIVSHAPEIPKIISRHHSEILEENGSTNITVKKRSNRLPDLVIVNNSAAISAVSNGTNSPNNLPLRTPTHKPGALSKLSFDLGEEGYADYERNSSLDLPAPVRRNEEAQTNIDTSPLSPILLLMGSAQVSGGFIVDNSMIRESEFNDVKRQSTISNGVGVGIIGTANRGTSNSGAGFLKDLASGIGSFLRSADDMSSFEEENKKNEASKSVPILQTLQTVLFIDLLLKAGETKTYRYELELPKELPPTYRGRAVRIAYTLIIGIQTQRGGELPQYRYVRVPFRVSANISQSGSQPVYDVFSPIIQLKEEASTSYVSDYKGSKRNSVLIEEANAQKLKKNEKGTKLAFIKYLDELLSSKDGVVQSPDTESTVVSPDGQATQNCRDNIESTVRSLRQLHARGNENGPGFNQKTLFTINWGKSPVTTVSLSKPIYKVGEQLNFFVDFSIHSGGLQSLRPYYLVASLEVLEKVDASVSTKSNLEPSTYVGKVHSELRRWVASLSCGSFSLNIPASATAQFTTSIFSVEWYLHLQIIVSVEDLEAAKQMTEKSIISEQNEHEPRSTEPLVQDNPLDENTMSDDQNAERRQTEGKGISANLYRARRDLFELVSESPDSAIFQACSRIFCGTVDCRVPLSVLPTNQHVSAQPGIGYPR